MYPPPPLPHQPLGNLPSSTMLHGLNYSAPFTFSMFCWPQTRNLRLPSSPLSGSCSLSQWLPLFHRCPWWPGYFPLQFPTERHRSRPLTCNGGLRTVCSRPSRRSSPSDWKLRSGRGLRPVFPCSLQLTATRAGPLTSPGQLSPRSVSLRHSPTYQPPLLRPPSLSI